MFIVEDSDAAEYNFAVSWNKGTGERRYFAFDDRFASFMGFVPIADETRRGQIRGKVFELGDHVVKLGIIYMFTNTYDAMKIEPAKVVAQVEKIMLCGDDWNVM
jgi:hypothetical protein